MASLAFPTPISIDLAPHCKADAVHQISVFMGQLDRAVHLTHSPSRMNRGRVQSSSIDVGAAQIVLQRHFDA